MVLHDAPFDDPRPSPVSSFRHVNVARGGACPSSGSSSHVTSVYHQSTEGAGPSLAALREQVQQINAVLDQLQLLPEDQQHGPPYSDQGVAEFFDPREAVTRMNLLPCKGSSPDSAATTPCELFY